MPPSKSKSKKAVLSAPMKKAVDAEIKKITAPAEEIKYNAIQWTKRQIGATLDTTAGVNLYEMLPPVAPGVDAWERIGNSLSPKGLKTHFAMYFDSAAVNTANIYVRLLCVSSREVKSYNGATSLVGNNLFLDGQGGARDLASATYADNLSTGQFLPVNKKSWIVHHDKVIHLAKGYGYPNNDTTSLRTPTGYVPLCARVTVDIPHKAALKYDSATDTIANNFAPFWCAYAWTADGGTASIYPVQVDTRSDLYFVG